MPDLADRQRDQELLLLRGNLEARRVDLTERSHQRGRDAERFERMEHGLARARRVRQRGSRNRLRITFRQRGAGELIESVLDVPGVMVVGSEVPNLLEPGVAATLVVSQNVDIAIPIAVHGEVKARLDSIVALTPSAEEPSVWVPRSGDELIEVNFLGIDPAILDPIDTYERSDDRLPLMVFGTRGQLPASRIQRTSARRSAMRPAPRQLIPRTQDAPRDSPPSHMTATAVLCGRGSGPCQSHRFASRCFVTFVVSGAKNPCHPALDAEEARDDDKSLVVDAGCLDCAKRQL